MLIAIKTNTGWVVDFRASNDADEIRRLFGGTTVLPTSFLPSATWAIVQAQLQALNPGEEIVTE